jgi:hypothetical protein
MLGDNKMNQITQEPMLIGLKALWKEISDRKYQNIEGLKAETTEEEYWDMLEVLPPLKMNNGCFYMSEFQTGDLTEKHWKENGKFYCQIVDFRKEFPKMSNKEYNYMR